MNDEIILVGGLPASGKSTFLEELSARRLPTVANVLGVPPHEPPHVATLAELAGEGGEAPSVDDVLAQVPGGRLFVHVDLFALRQPERRTVLERLLDSRKGLRFLAVAASLREFRSRYGSRRKRSERSLWRILRHSPTLQRAWYVMQRSYGLPLIYRSERRVMSYYDEWVALAARHRKRVVLVDANDMSFRHFQYDSPETLQRIVRGHGPRGRVSELL